MSYVIVESQSMTNVGDTGSSQTVFIVNIFKGSWI